MRVEGFRGEGFKGQDLGLGACNPGGCGCGDFCRLEALIRASPSFFFFYRGYRKLQRIRAEEGMRF